MKRFVIILEISLVIFLIAINLCSKNIYIRSNLINSKEIVIGIIDGKLSESHSNLKNNIDDSSVNGKRHGDEVLDFIEKYDRYAKVLYYNAEEEGEISSESILNGLNWMLGNNINYICISLSSSYYSNEIDNWLNQNAEKVKVYASYNNVSNTFDYPAQYTDVIGVGSNSDIEYKTNDVKFCTSKVIIINQGIYLYEGNSYLAPLQLINDIRNQQ